MFLTDETVSSVLHKVLKKSTEVGRHGAEEDKGGEERQKEGKAVLLLMTTHSFHRDDK